MTSNRSPGTLEATFDRIEAAGDNDVVTLEEVRNAVGQKAFGPLLLIAGLVTLSPIGGVPGVPTAMAIIVLLVSVQLLAGMDGFWLPRFILERSVRRSRLSTAVRYLRPVARVVDRVLRERAGWLTRKPFTYLIAVTCAALATIMPPLELVPFANAAPGAAVTAFGLAIMADDGIVAIAAFAMSAVSFYLIASTIL